MNQDLVNPPTWWNAENYLELDSYEDITEEDKAYARADIIDVVSRVPQTAPSLLDKMAQGQIGGRYYGRRSADKECAVCLLGTVLTLLKKCTVDVVDAEWQINDLIRRPNVYTPAEVWFLKIEVGDTPETNPFMRDAYDWIRAWLDEYAPATSVSEREAVCP